MVQVAGSAHQDAGGELGRARGGHGHLLQHEPLRADATHSCGAGAELFSPQESSDPGGGATLGGTCARRGRRGGARSSHAHLPSAQSCPQAGGAVGLLSGTVDRTAADSARRRVTGRAGRPAGALGSVRTRRGHVPWHLCPDGARV